MKIRECKEKKAQEKGAEPPFCWGLCPKIQFIGISQIIKLFNYMRLFINELMGHYLNP